MKKRMLSLLLCLVMMLGLLPTSALAADTDAVEVWVDGKKVSTYDSSNQDLGWRDVVKSAIEGKSAKLVLLSDWKSGGSAAAFCREKIECGFNNSTFYVPEGVTVTMDLNGHTIDRDIGNATSTQKCRDNGEVIYVQKNATFNLISTAKTHGTIMGGGSLNGAGGIHIKEGATVNLDNVYVRGNWSVKGSGNGGGVMMDGEKIRLNLKNGSKIIGNWAQNDGGGVYMNGDYNILTMDDTSAITGNTSTENGGGVYIDNENCTISGGSITDNKAEGWGGGGVCDNNDDNTISNCTITGNKADGGNGGGVYVDSETNLSLSGKMIIKDNTDHAGNPRDLYLQDGDYTHAYLSGTPSTGSRVGVYRKYSSTGNYAITVEAGTYDETLFFADETGRAVYWDWDQNTGAGGRNLRIGSTSDKIARPTATVEQVAVNARTETTANGYENSYALIKGIFTYASVADKETDHDARYFYSDGYFAKAASEYNEHLATMSLCLAMSAFGANAGTDVDYTNKFAHVKQLLSDIGCADKDIYISETYTQKPGTDTIGVAIASKAIKIGNEDYTLIPIAVRGAGYESEWASNVSVGKSGEEQGFADAANQVTAQVEQYIADHGLSDAIEAGKVKFWVVGYSRAGATANLTSKRLTDKYGEKNQVYGYDFEAPQGGVQSVVVNNTWTSDGGYRNIHNIINKADLVPMVAPTAMGFMRYGVDHYAPGDEISASVITTDTETQAGNITTYSDNSPLATKKRGSSNYGEAYAARRALMLPQLAAVNKDIVFDDYFRVATTDVFWATVWGKFSSDINRFDEIKDLADVPVEDWERQFFIDFQAWTLKDSYITDYRQYYSGKTLRGNTIQDALRVAVQLVFGRSPEEAQQMINTMLINADRISTFSIYNVIPFTSGISMLSMYDEVLGDWHKLTEAEQDEYIDYLWKILMISDGSAKNVTDYMSPTEAAQLKEAWPTIATLLFQFASNDYRWNKLNNLGTLAYNASSVMQAHYPEVNLAWLRTYDSFYTDETNPETKAYDLTLNSYTVAPPTITKVVNANTGTEIEAGTLYGDHIVSLGSEGANGQAIYYKLTTQVDGGATTTSDWQLYENGIFLPVKGKMTRNILTAKAVSFGKSSAEMKPETIDIYNDAFTVTVKTVDGNDNTVTTTYPYRTDDTVTINANTPSNKVFSEWTVTENAVAVQNSEIATFTMPGKDVTVTASYTNKVSEVPLTIIAPSATASLASTAETTLNEKRLTPSILWTTGNNSPVSGTADYNTVYTAHVIIPADKAKGIVFSESVTASVNTDTKAMVTRNNADGSIVVSYTFPATAKAKLTDITAPSAVSVPHGTTSSGILNYLPVRAELITEAGSVYGTIQWTKPTFTEQVDTQTVTVDGTVTVPDSIEAGSVSTAVSVKVTIEAAAKTSAPTTSLTPGAYTANQSVTLSAVEGASIYYTLDGTDPTTSITKTEYTQAIALTGENGVLKTYTIKAIAVKNEFSDSSISTFVYKIELPAIHTVTIVCSDTAFAPTETPWSETQSYTYYKVGESLTITAPIVVDEVFDHWANGDNTNVITDGDESNKNDRTITVPNTNPDLKLKAIYTPVVNEIKLTIAAPTAGQALATTVSSADVRVTKWHSGVADMLADIIWTPTAADGKAGYNASYTAKVTILPAVAAKINFLLADKLTITVNGGTATASAATDANGKLTAVYVTFPSTSAAKLLSVTAPSGVTAANKTDWRDVVLPKTVRISVQDKSVTSATVNWTMPTAYSKSTLESQTFEVEGTVTLPDGVSNAGNVPLTVTIPLYVAAAQQVEMPNATPGEGSSFTEAQQVRLSCATDGAVIRYTTNGTAPTAYSPGYTSPITVSSSTVIKAVAMKNGMRDSTPVTYTYTITSPAPVAPGSGGSGGGNSNYAIAVAATKNGSVGTSSESAASGTKLTITVMPNKGFALETLTVTKTKGDTVALTKNSNGTYTFTMPASNVTVSATFMEDNTILNHFVDVPASAYYYDAVLWAAENGITSGTDTSHFNPNATCTRAQAVTFLWRAMGEPEPTSTTNPFTDVSRDVYYYEAVLWAAEKGITGGTSATTFSPNAVCSRAQIVTFQYRAAGSPAGGTVNPFADVADSAYYANAVKWAVSKEITGGTTATTFSPNADCTRAQIVTFLWRQLSK